MLTYAGIGSRKATGEVMDIMTSIAEQLAPKWHLRSGYAHGADMAFGRGAETAEDSFTMYLPWDGYNGAPNDDERFITIPVDIPLLNMAAQFHPAWNKCSEVAKLMHARNLPIVLGSDLNTPVDMIICWTPNGRIEGGTGQAMRVAHAYNIPVFNLYHEEDKRKLSDYVDMKENIL